MSCLKGVVGKQQKIIKQDILKFKMHLFCYRCYRLPEIGIRLDKTTVHTADNGWCAPSSSCSLQSHLVVAGMAGSTVKNPDWSFAQLFACISCENVILHFIACWRYLHIKSTFILLIKMFQKAQIVLTKWKTRITNKKLWPIFS